MGRRVWEYFFDHVELFIQVSLVAVVLGVLFVIYRSYFSKNAEATLSSTGAVDLSAIEVTLSKILERQAEVQVHASLSAVEAQDAVAGDPAMELRLKELTGKMDSLNKELLEKTAEIETLKSGDGAAVSGSSADLEGKIKDLQARLEEYEIISEDLADLSMYKNENAKLKQEIAQLKSLPVASPPAAPAAPSPAAVAPAPAAEASVPASTATTSPVSTPTVTGAASVAASDAEPSAQPTTALAPAAAPSVAPPEDVVSDDLMREFELAVANQKKAEVEKINEKTSEAGELIDQFENFVKKEG